MLLSKYSKLVTESLYLFSLYLSLPRRCHCSSAVRSKTVTLITFDVDGTLIHGSSQSSEESAHAKAFSYGIGEVFTGDGHSFLKRFHSPLAAGVDPKKYHGSTDGLIALNFVKVSLNISPQNAMKELPLVFESMYRYIAGLADEEIIKGIEPLPGVIEQLSVLSAKKYSHSNRILCGLVTGNVEGIARKKMRACGIYQTGVLSPKSSDQVFDGENEFSVLGGFGSDYCSADIDDAARIYKDRAEQIAIAVKRAKSQLSIDEKLVRVIHVGDAPGDVLAAKWCHDQGWFGESVSVGCIAVATGKFSAGTLFELIGEPVPGKWEPVVLEKGIADPSFLSRCGIE